MKMLEHDIADRRFLGIIRGFLKAGIMEEGKYIESESGSPQRVSLQNRFLRTYTSYLLNIWFSSVQRRSQGQCYLIEYSDDFFLFSKLLERQSVPRPLLKNGLRRFRLSLAEERRKFWNSQVCGKRRKKRGERKPETHNFLGFTFYCSMRRKRRNFSILQNQQEEIQKQDSKN